MTVDYCWDLFPDGFVLMDSDILIKRDITPFFDMGVAWAGQVFANPRNVLQVVPRLLPFLCWINVPMCRKAGIRYFDPRRNWRLTSDDPFEWYDTGASFYEDCSDQNLPHKDLNLDDYIIHYGGGSYRTKKEVSPAQWLELHKDLYR